MRPVLACLALCGCVVPPIGADCTLDSDYDGVCDAFDPCPLDALDDRDGDGVCGDLDQCPGAPDDEDGDGDGVPDGCDPCPDDTTNDPDGDGLCSDEDPCPDSADDDCGEVVFLAIQVDGFAAEATWTLVGPRGEALIDGSFTGPADGYVTSFEVPVDDQSCLTVRDAFGDGGTRGQLFSVRRGLRYASWTFDDYTRLRNFCFDPSVGTPAAPPREGPWLRDGACEVTFEILTGSAPADVGWQVQTGTERTLWSVSPGTYGASAQRVTQALTLTDGTYRFQMLDGTGDGWLIDGASATLTLEGETAPFATAVLQAGTEGWQEFVIDCG